MAEQFSSTKLEPDAHLLLDQPLLRVPHELLRKNLKSAQRQIEIANKSITSAVQTNPTQSPADTLASLDATLAKAQSLKRKLEALQAEEKALQRQQKARIEHLEHLHEIPNLADVKYDAWSHVRLDRLLVDYMLRQGYTESARELAKEKGIVDLADVAVFEACGKIESSLREGRTQECLAWCGENKQALKKINVSVRTSLIGSGGHQADVPLQSNLELELRMQQFIELTRSGEDKPLMDAIAHARKHFGSGQDHDFGLRAGGLLTYGAETSVEPYRVSNNAPRGT